MARPIKETPVLTGEDAVRFELASHNVVPATQQEKDDAKKALEFFKSIYKESKPMGADFSKFVDDECWNLI